jgi:transposase-like protein
MTEHTPATARRYGISAGQWYTWRRLALENRLGGDDGAQGFAPAGTVQEKQEPATMLPLRGGWRSRRRARRVIVDKEWMQRRWRGSSRCAATMILFQWCARMHRDRAHGRGFDGLALQVQETLKQDPHCGHLFVFRGRRRRAAVPSTIVCPSASEPSNRGGEEHPKTNLRRP